MTEKKLDYNVVFQDQYGIRTYTTFHDAKHYETWLQEHPSKGDFATTLPITRGVDEEQARQLMNEVPIKNYVVRAIDICTNPQTNRTDFQKLDFEIANLVFLEQYRTNCSAIEASTIVSRTVTKVIVERMRQII